MPYLCRFDRRALLARRLLTAPAPPVRRRRSSRLVRAVIASVLVLVLVGLPMREPAQASVVLGPKVIAQLNALLGNLTMIKRKTNQFRNQARNAFSGHLAPLATRFRTVNCSIFGFVPVPRGHPTYCTSNLEYEPPRFNEATVPGPGPIYSPPFNEAPAVCGPDTVPGGDCYELEITATVLEDVSTTADDLAGEAWDQLYPGGIPDYITDQRARRLARDTARRAPAVAAQQRFERTAANRRSLLTGATSILEEWRGCQGVPFLQPGATPSAENMVLTTDARAPCVTNGGLGRGTGRQGTTGMLQEMAAQFDLIESSSDGAASQNQVSSLKTQLLLMRSRLQAAVVEIESHDVELQHEAQLQAQSQMRRKTLLTRNRLLCLQGDMDGVTASVFNRYIPPATGQALGPTGDPAGECIHVPEATP